MKAPQIRYEKVVPPARKDVATEQLNAGLRAKKRLDASSSHAVVGAMLASKPGEVGPAAADTLTAGVVTESTADGLKASMDDNELRRATPAPARVPGMEIRAASAPSSSETVQVTRDAAAFETQASAPQAMAKRRQEGALEGSNLSSQLPDQHFTHVQTIGTHVWACGFDGGLVHSTDGGINWTRLTPTDKHAKLQGDIISIVFADVNHGTLKTSTEETWTTSDAGQSWKKK
jgi:hypothetical protein